MEKDDNAKDMNETTEIQQNKERVGALGAQWSPLSILAGGWGVFWDGFLDFWILGLWIP